ncbi:hypothetical protein M0804_001860 [Polistes exclamans]|nr:hypothetical protein M0804_001860 [Polistes exclamans]
MRGKKVATQQQQQQEQEQQCTLNTRRQVGIFERRLDGDLFGEDKKFDVSNEFLLSVVSTTTTTATTTTTTVMVVVVVFKVANYPR